MLEDTIVDDDPPIDELEFAWLPPPPLLLLGLSMTAFPPHANATNVTQTAATQPIFLKAIEPRTCNTKHLDCPTVHLPVRPRSATPARQPLTPKTRPANPLRTSGTSCQGARPSLVHVAPAACRQRRQSASNTSTPRGTVLPSRAGLLSAGARLACIGRIGRQCTGRDQGRRASFGAAAQGRIWNPISRARQLSTRLSRPP